MPGNSEWVLCSIMTVGAELTSCSCVLHSQSKSTTVLNLVRLQVVQWGTLLEEVCAEHVLYKTLHSNHFYKKVFNLFTTSLHGL